MSELFEYNGYSGSIEVSLEDRCLFGKILFIADLVTYEAETIADLEAEFIAAVDDYIATCKEMGKDPQRPFKGSFNVRIGMELHRKAAMEAYKKGVSLNEYISKAIEAYTRTPATPINVEHHNHVHYHTDKHVKNFTVTFPENAGDNEWKISPAIMSK